VNGAGILAAFVAALLVNLYAVQAQASVPDDSDAGRAALRTASAKMGSSIDSRILQRRADQNRTIKVAQSDQAAPAAPYGSRHKNDKRSSVNVDIPGVESGQGRSMKFLETVNENEEITRDLLILHIIKEASGQALIRHIDKPAVLTSGYIHAVADKDIVIIIADDQEKRFFLTPEMRICLNGSETRSLFDLPAGAPLTVLSLPESEENALIVHSGLALFTIDVSFKRVTHGLELGLEGIKIDLIEHDCLK
jgi:hypothetical protein